MDASSISSLPLKIFSMVSARALASSLDMSNLFLNAFASIFFIPTVFLFCCLFYKRFVVQLLSCLVNIVFLWGIKG